MDLRWEPTPQDSSREVTVILHQSATFVEILNGSSTDDIDLTPFIVSGKHSSGDADITFSYNTELSGANQPKPGDLLEIRLSAVTLWVGVVDSIQDYSLSSSGGRRLSIKAYSRQNLPAWKDVKLTTPIYAAGTPVNTICVDVASAIGLVTDEIVIPPMSTYTVHSNMQLANMSAWDMLSSVLISSGYDPWIDARGRLTAINRDLARSSTISVSKDRIISVGGSKARSPVSSVRIKWLDPSLTEVTQQDQALDSCNITAGFFQVKQKRDVWFSQDRTQRAKNTYMVIKQSANSGLLPVCSENYYVIAPNQGLIELDTAYWAPALATLSLAVIAADAAIGDYAPFSGGMTIPVGKIIEAAAHITVLLIMMSIGTGIYEIRGQPYDFVHARNTSEAKAKGVPDWLLQILDIENDFTMSEAHAQTFAARELIYQTRAATVYKATITDDPRIEKGDILELYDGSRLYVLDYARDFSSGAASTLDVTGFRADAPTQSAIVSTPGALVPTAPLTLTATPVSSSEVDLTWTASTETGGTIASYVIYRDGVRVGSVPAPGVTFQDSGVTASTSYNYQVSAIDANGTEGPLSNPVYATTPTSGGSGGTSGSGSTPGAYAPPFPRTAFMGIGTTSTTNMYNNVGGLLADYSRYNVFVLPSGAEGWYINAGGGDRETMIQTAESLTTAPFGTKFLIYGQIDSYYTSSDPYPTLTAEYQARNWQLTTGSPYNGSGPLVTAGGGATVYVNYAGADTSTAYAGTNPSGETPYQFGAKYQWCLKLSKDRSGDLARFVGISMKDAAPSLKGVQIDNFFVDPRVAADWKRNGTLSTHDSGAYQGTWSDILANGQRQYVNQMAALIAAAGTDQWIGANCGDYAQAQLGNTLTTAGPMAGVLNQMNLEGCIGKSWSIETQHSYADLQTNIAQALAFLKAPKVLLLNFCLPNGGSSLSGGLPWNSMPTAVNGQHQWERYFVATALMNDGYCSIQFQSSGYSAELSDLTWPVEYDANGSQKGYLGNPIDAPQTGIRTWYDGSTVANAWAREFDNGLAIAIAKTGTGAAAQPTGTVTITGAQLGLGAGKRWKKIDGTAITSAGVTLQASRDGIVLLRDTGSVSGSGGGSGSPLPTIFQDDFSSGDLSHVDSTTGVKWASATNTAVSTQNPAPGKSHSLMFTWAGNPSPGQSIAEQRFDLVNPYTELQFDYDIYFCDGTEGFGSAAYTVRNNGTSTNNKFLRLWRGNRSDGNDGYGDFYTKFGGSLDRSTSPARYYNEYGKDSGGVGEWGANTGSEPDARGIDPLISSADLGKWTHITVYVKSATSANNDGVLTLSKNGVVVATCTTLPQWPSGGSAQNGIDMGYLMGYADSGFTNQTKVYIANFKISGKP